MANTTEYLLERIKELELEMAQMRCDYDELHDRHDATLECFEQLVEEHDILSNYLKPERNLVTCIIDGEDAVKIAKFFHLTLKPIRE